jgi:Tfp pilus assembly protein PilN
MTKTVREHFSVMDIVKLVGAVAVAIGGGAVVNTSSEPNERIAVLETKVDALAMGIPELMSQNREIIKSLDSLKIIIRLDVDREK